MSTGQINLLDEIIVDNFAGGGGASTGIELATGRVVDIAINHDPDAILMHRTNHPHTTHYQASVWDVDPVEVCRGRKVGLAWFSPDCKHFSKAKGGKPVDKNIRGLAWIVLRWAGTVRPRVIILENVEEFQTWGPVRKGKPVKKLTGQTFRKWLDQLRNLGYAVEWRELVAADYGAPTTRKRFFLIARCDGRPIVWPTPTHAPADSPEVKAGLRQPWRSAAEIIDWSLPTPSIFDTKESIREKYNLTAQRPLRPNTMARVARGVDKFVIKTASPFLVVVNHSGEFRGQDPGEPLQTVTAKHGYGVASPVLAPWTVTNTTNSTGHPVSEPVDTARTGGGGGQMFLSASLVQYHTEQGERVRGQGLDAPLLTVDASNRYGLSAVCLEKYYGTATGQGAEEPLHTITAKDREGVVAASLSKFYGGVVGAEMSQPLPTVTSIDHNAVQMAHMAKFYGNEFGEPMSRPLSTVTASGAHHGLVTTTVVPVSNVADLKNWPKIRELLNTYCGYDLKENEVILFRISGSLYFMADVGLRMLTPRELYRANGFPDDYIIDRDYTGKEYGKAKQVARCGNAVPPPFATALVRANLPEWCGQTITTMEELEKAVAV
ncbi:DNA cytosine methyltransferase [Muriventricola aceti]|uniref:DNA cytosine methyltransferase n=1 Tax=Muriventricola aceti TaxID=2981773 RepID=UPI0008211A24|nr:DNA cytosine methyltransferase [Muriventricola aceti]MCU6701305.1 DNA cytosine methyltransferase [Muriventricola aceti]SCI57038.1 DNA (cytosine-5-)-methyltransferase [uncultured Flavonifractor sp.]